ncbi:unnamed protein product [marine sediment metagenome]|uniref:Uncharacterized protein n=1 Tax=marine sediment metagenome TaxID=412755 RepID=X1KGE7_9ZZZZ
MIDKIQQAVGLVDRMANLSDDVRELLRKRIPEAASGDEYALFYVTRFAYDGKINRDVTNQILDLIRQMVLYIMP